MGRTNLAAGRKPPKWKENKADLFFDNIDICKVNQIRCCLETFSETPDDVTTDDVNEIVDQISNNFSTAAPLHLKVDIDQVTVHQMINLGLEANVVMRGLITTVLNGYIII